MPRLKVYDLATGTWQYAGGVNPVALGNDASLITALTGNAAFKAAQDSRYAPFPQGGRMGSALIAADQAGFSTTVTDIAGFTVTFTAVAGRIYRVDYTFAAAQVTSAGVQTFRLSDGATDLGVIAIQSLAANETRMVSGFFLVSGLSAASHTLKIRGSTTAGTMTISNAGATNGRLAVMDAGV
jgi:hypothetical protein